MNIGYRVRFFNFPTNGNTCCCGSINRNFKITGLIEFQVTNIKIRLKNIFFTANNKLRSVWFIPVFFILLTIFLFPTIVIAQKYSTYVSIPIQATLLIIVTVICQLLRQKIYTTHLT